MIAETIMPLGPLRAYMGADYRDLAPFAAPCQALRVGEMYDAKVGKATLQPSCARATTCIHGIYEIGLDGSLNRFLAILRDRVQATVM